MPRKPTKLASENAQHTLEYMILLTLIMAGIIIGGPYAIRSWNAQVKGWEDSVIDSMTDPLAEAPPSEVSIPGCDPNPWTNIGCQMGATDSIGIPWNCSATQMLQTRTYSPLGCEVRMIPIPDPNTVRCFTDDSFHCCTDWVTPSGCYPGITPICPLESDCGSNVGCPDGEYRRTHTCDTGYTETECVMDGSCNFTCGATGQPPPNTIPAYGDFCDATDTTGLSNNGIPYIYINPGAPCTSAKCEVQCSPTFISYGTYCACPSGWTQYSTICCPPDQTEVGGVCQCASGFVKACPDGGGGWLTDQCYQGICGANQCEQ